MDDRNNNGMKLDMLPPFPANEIADMASRDTIAVGEFTLKNAASGIFFPDGTNNTSGQLALPIPATTVVQRSLQEVFSGMSAKCTNFEIFNSIVGADTVLVMDGKSVVFWMKKGKRNDAVCQIRSILTALTKNASGIADAARPITQNITAQLTTVNADSVKALYMSQIRSLIDSFISRDRFPYFVGVFRHNQFSFGH